MAVHGVRALVGTVHVAPCARYQRGSEVCQKLAESLAHLTGSEERELFDFGRRAGEAAPLMLILDRRDDPVTPLLLQWTFQVSANRAEALRAEAACQHGLQRSC
jgi:vacuolar protein sorting-associated protein 45